MSEGGIRVVAVERLDLRYEPRAWPWAEENRARIDRHFAKARAERPALWNGRVLILHRFAIEAATFRGAYLETDFASFLTWRDEGFADPSVKNCFAAGALRAADGAFLLGRMAKHTANAGKIYFPAGTPDPSDVRPDGAVDLAASVLRELTEETGISAGEIAPAPGWRAVIAGARIALMRPLRSSEPAEKLVARIRAFIAREKQAELEDIVVIRSPADFLPAMPDFVRAYLESEWNS
ncbi:MAG TPA: NUDIX hydrolase [Xanthobacteraceae bacterium]|nr:NUDIX hydrolase [Xanthobacteraceae bacterium]